MVLIMYSKDLCFEIIVMIQSTYSNNHRHVLGYTVLAMELLALMAIVGFAFWRL